jgi:hypothetical protein
VASRALRRSAAAVLGWPWARRMAMARLLRLAMARGAVPVRTCEARGVSELTSSRCPLVLLDQSAEDLATM